MADRRENLETFRRRLYEELDLDTSTGEPISALNVLIFAMILLSAFLAALTTEPTLGEWGAWLHAANVTFTVVFTIEYAARLWVKSENPRYSGRLGRLRYATRWYSVIDLLALFGMWIEALSGVGLGWVVMLRLARVLRVFALHADSAAGRAARAMRDAVTDRKAELTLAGILAALVMMTSAVAMYLVERDVQPETFGSIPRALYWAVVTLTTVGYGDVTPATALGKVIASLTALCSIALIAVPAGIMASAFSDAVQRMRRLREHQEGLPRRPKEHHE